MNSARGRKKQEKKGGGSGRNSQGGPPKSPREWPCAGSSREAQQAKATGREGLCVQLPPEQLGERQAQEVGWRAGPQGASYSLNGLPSDLRHDGALPAEVFVTQAQEIVDDQGCEERVHSEPVPSTGWASRWRNSEQQ